jgi:hypothetical protein
MRAGREPLTNPKVPIPVWTLTAVTVAPVTTAPLESVTTPEILPVILAKAAVASNAMKHTARTTVRMDPPGLNSSITESKFYFSLCENCDAFNEIKLLKRLNTVERGFISIR